MRLLPSIRNFKYIFLFFRNKKIIQDKHLISEDEINYDEKNGRMINKEIFNKNVRITI